MNHARRGQSFRTGVDEGRRNREVEGAIALGAALGVERLASPAQVLIIGGLGERAAIEMQHRGELRPVFFLDLAARELLDAAERERAILLVVEILHREAEDRELVGQFAVDRKIVQRGNQLAMAQVAGAAENHHDARIVVIAFLDGMEMVEIDRSPVCSRSHKRLSPLAIYSLTTPWPPNSSRSAASNFSPKVPSPLSGARAKAREQRHRDHRHRDVFVDCVLHRPAALARVLDVAADLLEARIFFQRVRRQLQEPRSHDAAMPPEVRDLAQVEACTPTCASPRSLPRTPASARTRCRCGPSSRNGRRRGRRRGRSRRRGARVLKIGS